MADPPSPCRLFVYLARDAPIGVVLRRGPSAWTRLSLWHTESDVFEHGQWIAARVYERRCDLSPDGSLFVAFVRGSGKDTSADSWIAVSRPPWFTALALWFVGGTYHTGGYFPDRQTLWLGFSANRPDRGTLPGWLAATAKLPPYIDRTNDWPSRTVWLNRLVRDGWSRREGVEPETWERRSPNSGQILAMIIRSATDHTAYGGRFVIEYAVDRDGDTASLGEATWADWDRHGRLVLAKDGRLFSCDPSENPREIADFNGQAPDPRRAQESALTWPDAPR